MTNHISGWSWESLPMEIKRRFPAPPDRSKFSSDAEHGEAKGFWQERFGRNIGIILQQHKSLKNE